MRQRRDAAGEEFVGASAQGGRVAVGGELEIPTGADCIHKFHHGDILGYSKTWEFFERAVHFARKYDIAICHDGPYSEVAYDEYVPVSFMQAKGAMDVGIEFHSLSKSYNMTGWRIGMAVGNPQIIDALMRVKSNIDSGASQAIQRMAIAALDGPQESIAAHNAIYQRRRDKVVDALRKLGLQVTPPKASLYVWARVPEGMTSAGFAERLLDQAAVIVTPGNGYGAYGEGYVRLSLTLPDDRVDEGLRRIAAVPALA